VLFLPILFGPAGIVCAGIAVSKGDKLGKPALAVAIIGMIVGFILGFVVYANS
jgi:tetrahydromethanopterin S-methyltransferase subunit C